MQTVRQWLEQLGLPQYAEVFENPEKVDDTAKGKACGACD
jgi:hypothetical protein